MKKTGLKDWWRRHKPSRRRLIQVYAALLYNAYIKGFIKGEIFTGLTKTVCVPGLNCYSCPGAVGACPLGSLQNALANSKARTPFYVFGIIMLYGLILGRTICGFLCPVGLVQELIYKLKTPKVKKNGVTRILSYFKYVVLGVLVFGIPIVYALDRTVVPGFCKYICPAGTLGGAVALLAHPSNDALYTMLGPLFTWKMVVLVALLAASVFIYRVFCRFLCPLGALYGFFNKISLLGVKVEKSQCTDCGKCVTACKMDIKKVGDHECIGCGECIGHCPTGAISFKGKKAIVMGVSDPQITPPTEKEKTKKKNKKALALKVVVIALALALLGGVTVYANFFAGKKDAPAPTPRSYLIAVSHADPYAAGVLLSFTIGESETIATPTGGSGTHDDPFLLPTLAGRYDVAVNTYGETCYFLYQTTKEESYTVRGDATLQLNVYKVSGGKEQALYRYEEGGEDNILRLSLDDAEQYGNTVGYLCYDATLDAYNGAGHVTVSDYRGKIVFLNFWYTGCGPCKVELPFFEEIKNEYDNVEVIAIHNAPTNDDVQSFLNATGWNEWHIFFAQDTANGATSEYYDLLGGKRTYPRTLVLDGEGVIRYVIDESLTKADLVNIVEALTAKE